MAGDWIKLEHATPDKPEIYRLARLLDISRGDAFLLSVRWWIWLDRNTCNGNVTLMLRQDVDELMSTPGFAAAMEDVRWLSFDADGVACTTPNFDRHNGETAKNRALTNRRVKEHREHLKREGNAASNGASVTNALPEKRREEVTTTTRSRADALADARPAKPSAVNVTGTRLDPLWTLPADWAEWAQGERPDWTLADVERVGMVFRDHWHSKAGKDARKTDWLATWRNWVRNERRRYAAQREPTIAERRGSSIDAVIARGNADGRIINGSAERMDRAPVLALSGRLREQGGHDVWGDDGRPARERAAGE